MIPTEIQAALEDLRRGHRITEWEDVAHRLGAAVREHFEIPEQEPTSTVERISYWANRILDNDGALSASSSMDLDYAHDELTKALEEYRGPQRTTGARQALKDMQAEVVAWAITKGWHGERAPEVRFGEAMALLHSEVSEALEAYRDWQLADATATGCVRCAQSGVGACDDAPHIFKPEGVGSEFADVLIRLLHYSEVFGVDLPEEYARKMEYNHTRAFRHGGRVL